MVKVVNWTTSCLFTQHKLSPGHKVWIYKKNVILRGLVCTYKREVILWGLDTQEVTFIKTSSGLLGDFLASISPDTLAPPLPCIG